MMVIKDSLNRVDTTAKLGEIIKQNDEFSKMLDKITKQNDEMKKINEKLKQDFKEQDKIFKHFDLALIRNQILFGNLDEAKQSELFKKSLKIAKELSEL